MNFKRYLLTAALGFMVLAARAQDTDLSLHNIVIDPGHGGNDPGTVSRDRKTREKDLTLRLSQLLSERLLAEYPSMNVTLTRTKDVFVPLNDRAKIATKAGAQLFISIHINAVSKPNPAAQGFAAYILGQSKNYDSYGVNLDVCKRENSVIFLEEDYTTTYQDFDPDSAESQIFLQLMQNAYREQSLKFAQKVCEAMKQAPFRKVWDVMQDNFCVLRLASMPAVLLECGYMTDTQDLAVLRNPKELEKLADRMLEAFKSYKAAYDSSVMIDRNEPAVTAVTAVTPAQPAETVTSKEASSAQPAEEGECMYGVQVCSGSKLMMPTDRFFRGHHAKAFKADGIYRYVIGMTGKRQEAEKFYGEVRDFFDGCFLVKIQNGKVEKY